MSHLGILFGKFLTDFLFGCFANAPVRLKEKNRAAIHQLSLNDDTQFLVQRNFWLSDEATVPQHRLSLVAPRFDARI